MTAARRGAGRPARVSSAAPGERRRGGRPGPAPRRGPVYQDPGGRFRVIRADGRRLDMIPAGSVGVIVTSPPYWVRGRGRRSAERYARDLAAAFGRQWWRVLRDDGDLWLVIGDRHDGAEWVGIDEAVVRGLRREGWRLQAKGFWAQTGSRERWDNRVNHVLRFAKPGRVVPPRSRTLCWTLPLPRSHPESRWDATPEPVIRAALEESRQRGAVLDPFAGAGTVGLVARAMGRRWIGVERDPKMAALAARRLRLKPEQARQEASGAPARRPGRPRRQAASASRADRSRMIRARAAPPSPDRSRMKLQDS